MLVPCSGCRRHARVEEGACPFCGASLQARPRRSRVALRYASRAALFYFGTSLASACGIAGGPAEEETIAQPYGAPPDPPPEDEDPPEDETTDGNEAIVVQPYGAPPNPETAPPPEPDTETEVE